MKINLLLQVLIILVLISLIPHSIYSQKTRKTPKFHIGIEDSVGNNFPNFITEQQKWKATVYGAWSASLSVNTRIHKNWSAVLIFPPLE